MKKFIYILIAITLLSCTKSEVAYEPTHEIGFTAAAGNITKAVVSGDVYPTDLNMYINSYVHSTDVPTTPDYIENGEFTYLNPYGAHSGDNNASPTEKNTNVWGGGSSKDDRHPYHWPNTRTLHFSGYSKSGNVGATSNAATASYDPSTDKLTITGYNPGTGNNDLMWFPSTKYTNGNGYDKNTKYVPVNMYHTCSWITFMVQGDQTTGGENSTYKITSLTMNGVDMTGDVVCTGSASLSQSDLSTYIVWSENDTQTGDNTTYNVTLPSGGVELKATCQGNYITPKNIETGEVRNEPDRPDVNNVTRKGNIIVIPQKPGSIDITWTYETSTGVTMSDSATGLSLSLGKETVNSVEVEKPWQPGKHYIYTITIKANEIVIAPTPVTWTEGNWNVTVE